MGWSSHLQGSWSKFELSITYIYFLIWLNHLYGSWDGRTIPSRMGWSSHLQNSWSKFKLWTTSIYSLIMTEPFIKITEGSSTTQIVSKYSDISFFDQSASLAASPRQRHLVKACKYMALADEQIKKKSTREQPWLWVVRWYFSPNWSAYLLYDGFDYGLYGVLSPDALSTTKFRRIYATNDFWKIISVFYGVW
jgi:hypothetical protein